MRLALLSLVCFWNMSSFAQTGNVSIRATTPMVARAGSITYGFALHDDSSDRDLTDSDLAISHEKKLHFMVFDEALMEFRHVHPAYDGSEWTVEFDLNRNGHYWLWAQGTVADGSRDFTASARLEVQGGDVAWPAPAHLTDLRSGQDGISQVDLSGGKITAGKTAMLNLTFSRTDGSTPALSDYLGAFAHVVAVPESGDALLHVHPMPMGPTEGMIHVMFPSPGKYRLWIQFIDDGDLKLVSLAVEVQ